MKSARENAHVKGIVCEREIHVRQSKQISFAIRLEALSELWTSSQSMLYGRSKLHRSENDHTTARIIVTIMTL